MNANSENISTEGEREYNSGKRSLEVRKAMNATASPRVQRGTNRPLGKSKKNNVMQISPRIWTLRTGNHQAGWEEIKVSATVMSNVTVPNATRNAETNSAIRSSERCQKMMVPTANHTSSKILSMTTFR